MTTPPAPSDSQRISPFRDIPPSREAITLSPPLPEAERRPAASSFDRLVEVNMALTDSVTRLVRVLWLFLLVFALLQAAALIPILRH